MHEAPSLSSIEGVVARSATTRRRLILRQALILAPPILGGALLLAIPPLLIAHARPLPEPLLRWHLPILLVSAAVLFAWLLWADRPDAERSVRELGRLARDEERLVTVMFPWRPSPLRALVAAQVARRSPSYDPRRLTLPTVSPILIALSLLTLLSVAGWWVAPRPGPSKSAPDALLREVARSLGLDENVTRQILPEALRAARTRDEMVEAARRILRTDAPDRPITLEDIEELARAIEEGRRPAARALARDVIAAMKRARLEDAARERLRHALQRAAATEPDDAVRAALSATAQGDLGAGLAAALGLGRAGDEGAQERVLAREKRLALAILQAAGATGSASVAEARDVGASARRAPAHARPGGPALVGIPPEDREIARKYLELHGWEDTQR